GRSDRANRGSVLGDPCVAVGFEPQSMQRKPLLDQLGDNAHSGCRHENVQRLHSLRPFPPALDVAHATAMASPDGMSPARRRPLVRRLMLRDFRSYAALDLMIGDRLVVLCGENGAGKTNLLEALSLLAPGRGLRRAELA